MKLEQYRIDRNNIKERRHRNKTQCWGSTAERQNPILEKDSKEPKPSVGERRQRDKPRLGERRQKYITLYEGKTAEIPNTE